MFRCAASSCGTNLLDMMRLKLSMCLTGRAKCKWSLRKLAFAIVLVAGLQAGPALAQQSQIPLGVSPSQVQRGLEEPLRTPVPPKIELPARPSSKAPSHAKSVVFKFSGIEIDGASVLSETRLMSLWRHVPGETVSVADVFQYAEDITKLYRNEGYALSFAVVPKQQIIDGVFHVHVIEGRVTDVEVTGSVEGPVRAQVERIAKHIKESVPLRSEDLERYMLLVNDLPGVEAKGILSPSDTAAGATLTIAVVRNVISGTVSYNSYLPSSYGRGLVEVGGGFSGVLTGADSFQLGVSKSLVPGAYWGASAEMLTGVGSEGLTVGVKGRVSKLKPSGQLLESVRYRGKSYSVSFYGTYPVIRRRAENQSVGISFDMGVDQATLLDQPFFEDRLPSIAAWVEYSYTDSLPAVTSGKLTVRRGFSALGAEGESRQNGSLDYTTIEVELAREQYLGNAAAGAWTFDASLYGQIALASGQLYKQCLFGGRSYGRGFESGVLTGDHCIKFRGGPVWKQNVQFGWRDDPLVVSLTAFVDAGVVWKRGRLDVAEAREAHAVSTGIGASFQLGTRFSGGVELSRQLMLSNGSPERGATVLGSVAYKF